MVITKRNHKRKYVTGDAGIFDSIGNFFEKMFSRNAAKQLASATHQVGKTAAKDMLLTNYPHQNHKWLMLWFHQNKLLNKVNEVISKYVDTSAINLNKLIDGSSVNRLTASNAIAIQELVRWLNGSGLKVTYICFFFY